MTTYVLSVGYSSTVGVDKAVVRIEEIAKSIIAEQNKLIQEVRFSTTKEISSPELMEYAKCYNSEDLTIRFKHGEIIQIASGGGESREIKELFRQAFCRLVIKEANAEDINVNLNIH